MSRTRTILASAIALGTLAVAGQAYASDARIQVACAADYYSYCSQHDVYSPGLKTCMRANGPKLSKVCVNALIAGGYVPASVRTQMACSKDYYAHCSQHQVGSAGLRQCMAAVGPRLSKGCIRALVASGEVSKAQIAAHSAAKVAAK